MSTTHEVFLGVDSDGTGYLYESKPDVIEEDEDVVFEGDGEMDLGQISLLPGCNLTNLFGFTVRSGKCYRIAFNAEEVSA
ncbi:MAG: hypothetical protein AAGJ10_13840 [Bacteroidota bacterium]